ncbi:MAG: hypothetical protein JWM42_3191 [Burkholderia sp.]|nr:hypothetical protein [Burkholderia sp.]
MKTIFSAMLLAGACQVGFAAEPNALSGVGQMITPAALEAERILFSPGTPGNATTAGTETARIAVVDGLYHVPNHLPGFPTAATLWPRELPVECDRDPAAGAATCIGYQGHAALGRGEYIFMRPYVRVVARPARPEPLAPPPQPVATKKPLG